MNAVNKHFCSFTIYMKMHFKQREINESLMRWIWIWIWSKLNILTWIFKRLCFLWTKLVPKIIGQYLSDFSQVSCLISKYLSKHRCIVSRMLPGRDWAPHVSPVSTNWVHYHQDLRIGRSNGNSKFNQSAIFIRNALISQNSGYHTFSHNKNY